MNSIGHSFEMRCRTHPIVNKLSFLQSGAERGWKRPVLALLSLPIIGLGAAVSLGSFSVDGAIGPIILLLLGLITAAFGLLGLSVSMLGCSECVTKMFGRWTI